MMPSKSPVPSVVVRRASLDRFKNCTSSSSERCPQTPLTPNNIIAAAVGLLFDGGVSRPTKNFAFRQFLHGSAWIKCLQSPLHNSHALRAIFNAFPFSHGVNGGGRSHQCFTNVMVHGFHEYDILNEVQQDGGRYSSNPSSDVKCSCAPCQLRRFQRTQGGWNCA